MKKIIFQAQRKDLPISIWQDEAALF